MTLADPLRLPQSVKIRSTCNACQQAKIRCSHDKPSCRRCQKHNTVCIYSISRRLGRPAKKKETSAPRDNRQLRDHRRNKPSKRKRNEHRNSESEQRRTAEVPMGDELQTSLVEDSISANAELIAHSCQQDFVSGKLPDNKYVSLFDSLDPLMPFEPANPAVLLPPPTLTAGPDQSTSGYSSDVTLSSDAAEGYLMTPPRTSGSASSGSDFPKGDWYFNDLSLLLQTGQNSPLTIREPSSVSCENSPLDPQIQCQCYEQAVREVIRVSGFASQATYPSIDTILACQNGIQHLASTTLQCDTCSIVRVNILMVIIVSIDSLLAILETITSPAKICAFNPLFDEQLDIGVDFHISYGRRCTSSKAAMIGIESKIESCPLAVGSFRIPSDEKYCFVKQLLHVRLSGLLVTVRRIRYCTEEALTSSGSRGKQIMMMETDRRLQLVMTKIKMLSR